MVRMKGHGPKRYAYQPDYAVPPGQTLQETIDRLGIDQRELALRTELSPKHVNQIIAGVAPISQDTALRLERVTGVPARVWNNLEANYREQLVRVKELQRLQRELKWLKTIPTRELIKRGVIATTRDAVELLQSILTFFGVASVAAWGEVWSKPKFAFRKSLKFSGDTGAMATWLRLCELEARKVECQPFDANRFRKVLTEIRGLTVEEPEVFVPRIVSLAAESGVALVLVPEIKGAPVSGAAQWLTPRKAMIGLNLRGKSNDRFWFTFFHEAGHILLDSKKETYIDVEYADDPREQAANRFAANLLIPPGRTAELRRLRSSADVEAFARSIGVAPGIVVGRLQHDGLSPFTHFNGLKVRLRWASE